MNKPIVKLAEMRLAYQRKPSDLSDSCPRSGAAGPDRVGGRFLDAGEKADDRAFDLTDRQAQPNVTL